MIERICPTCQAGNTPDATTCVACGDHLEQPLMRRAGTLARRVDALPEQWQRAGKAIVVGAVAVAVEVGAAWLKQRADKRPAPLARVNTPQASSPQAAVVARQRVWETYEAGELTRRVVEQTIWRVPTQPDE